MLLVNTVESITYAYVANADRVSSITTTAAGVTVATQTYTYNARNQLTKERVQDGAPATTWERDYTYTAAGLRTTIDDLFNEWDCSFGHDPAGRLSLVQTTDNSGAAKANPFPWWEGDTRVSTSPNGDVVSMVSGANRITYRYDEEHRLVEAQMATGDPVAITYDGMGNLVSIVQGATTQRTLTYQGRIFQTRNASDVLQDRNFWMGGNLMRVNIDAAARNQTWDAGGSNVLSYQTDGTMDKARMWDNWGLEVFAAGAGSAPDVGFLSDFDLGTSGLSITPQNNAWWAELGRSVEGGWRPRFLCWPWDWKCKENEKDKECQDQQGQRINCDDCADKGCMYCIEDKVCRVPCPGQCWADGSEDPGGGGCRRGQITGECEDDDGLTPYTPIDPCQEKRTRDACYVCCSTEGRARQNQSCKDKCNANPLTPALIVECYLLCGQAIDCKQLCKEDPCTVFCGDKDSIDDGRPDMTQRQCEANCNTGDFPDSPA